MLVKWNGQPPLPTGELSQGPILPWYPSQYFNSVTPLLAVGSLWYDNEFGNVFQYVKASVALAQGQLVAAVATATDTVVNAGSTVQVVNLNSGGLTVNAEVGNFVYFADIPALRSIKANAAASITVSLTTSLLGNNQPDPDVLSAVPGNGTNVSIIRPWQVRVCTATLQPMGVALGTVTQFYYTMVQVAGLAQVLTVGSGTATAVGVPGVPSAGGVVIGSGGTANVYTAGGAIIPQYANSGASLLAPCIVNFIGA